MAVFTAGVPLSFEWMASDGTKVSVGPISAGVMFTVADAVAVEFEQSMTSTANTDPRQRHKSVPYSMAAWLRLQRGEPDGDHSPGVACPNPAAPACEANRGVGFVPIPPRINLGRIPQLSRIS